jgi:hypothetical protein
MLERRTASAGVLRAARVVGRFVAARARRVVVMWRMVVVWCVVLVVVVEDFLFWVHPQIVFGGRGF